MDISTCKLCIVLGDKDIKLVLVQVGMDGGEGVGTVTCVLSTVCTLTCTDVTLQ